MAPGAVPPDKLLNIMGFMTFPAPEVANAAQAAAASRTLLDAGVDVINLHVQPPPPPNPPFPASAIPAAVSEAHRLGKPVFVHPDSGADVLAAAREELMSSPTPLPGLVHGTKPSLRR